MARTSTVKRLPPELRDEIARLRDNGVTIDEILTKLRELGATVSRSALGRYVKEMDRVGERMRRSREMAEALVSRLGEEPSQLTKLNLELAHTVLFDLLTPDEEGRVSLDAEGAFFVTSSIQKLASAAKTDADLRMKIRKEVAVEAAAKVEKVAKSSGLSADTVSAIKAQILGIAS